MGDMVDFASPSNRAHLGGAKAAGALYDSALDSIEAAATEHLEWVKDLLAPTQGRWFGMVEGHHYFEFSAGDTTDMRLCNFLGCNFLGTSAYIRASFPSAEESKHKAPGVTFWVHHGQNGGRTLATPLNQLEKLVQGFDADVMLQGHHHKSVAGRISRIYPVFPRGNGKPRLEHRDVYLACTGSYLKGWADGQRRGGRPVATYAERGMMNPVSLGGIVVWLTPRWEQNGSAKVDVRIEV